MHFLSHLLLSSIALLEYTSALTIRRRDWLEPSAVASDWDKGICKPVGAIFARGTFDSGNIGTWVGPQFLEPLQAAGAAIQGVHQDIYPATLQSYLSFGTEDIGKAGPQELAAQVTNYLDSCSNSVVVISGWSQGALVARQGYLALDSPHQQRVRALVTFGDPITRFPNLQQDLPSSLPQLPHSIGCNTDTSAADPLCISLSEAESLLGSTATGSFTLSSVLGPWLQIPTLAAGMQQAISFLKLAVQFLPQLKQALPLFLDDLTTFQTAARLLLWPSHFFYGNNGHAEQAAQWVLQVEGVAQVV